jgi:hypothetical protein
MPNTPAGNDENGSREWFTVALTPRSARYFRTTHSAQISVHTAAKIAGDLTRLRRISIHGSRHNLGTGAVLLIRRHVDPLTRKVSVLYNILGTPKQIHQTRMAIATGELDLIGR